MPFVMARFSSDSMLQLTARELADWKSQIVTSNPAAKSSTLTGSDNQII